MLNVDCVKIFHISRFLDPHFLSFGLNTELYTVNLPIQSKWGKILTRKTPKADIFQAVAIFKSGRIFD